MKNNLVETRKGKVWSNSLIFAKEFNIAHKHILEKIENLTAENSAVKNMFYLTEYENERHRKYPMYYLDRDGVYYFAKDKIESFSESISIKRVDSIPSSSAIV